jgi:hypothetical protein
VSSYTISITPDDTTNASATLRVNLGLQGARITELTVRAGDGEGFAPEELPGFELSRLIGAIAPSRVFEAPTGAALPAAAPAVDVVHARAQDAPEAAARRSRPAKKALRRGRGAAKAAPAAKAGAKKATGTAAKAAKAAKKTAAKKTAAKSGQRESRAYRRMPDDIIAVFEQAGGATALANHYEVPRHTAQGWLRRLRQQGDIPA